MTNYSYRITLETADNRKSQVHTDYLEGALGIASKAEHICKCRGISANISVYGINEYGATLIQTTTVNPERVTQGNMITE